MKRPLSLNLAAILFLAVGGLPDNLRASMKASQKVPKAATVKIVLLNAPGMNDEGSKWEIAYEFRIANEITLWKAWKQGQSNGGSDQRVGELIKEGAIKAKLRPSKNCEVVFHIPFSPEIQERLRNQPRERVKTLSGQRTPEEIRLLKEQEIKSQVFLFYTVINIYDAKLKKNLIIPVSRSWNFDSNLQAQFEIKVEINSDGSYSVKSPPTAKKDSD
ncbi:MAG TPA: hypothetical protein VM095_11395 [Pyrinomonadaceae bacterium]|nr:hypothetical protein [Pyrinomonadaceae bacterium]